MTILHLPQALVRYGRGQHHQPLFPRRRPQALPLAPPVRRTFPQLLAACFGPESRPPAPVRASIVTALAWSIAEGRRGIADESVVSEAASLAPEVPGAERSARLMAIVIAIESGTRRQLGAAVEAFFAPVDGGSSWTKAS